MDYPDTTTADTTTNSLADERSQLKDSVRRFAERDYPFDARMRSLHSAPGFSTEHWQTFAELGWLSIGQPEDCGGFGGPLDQATLAEELGRALVVEPWLANCALAAPVLAALGNAQQRSLVADLCTGATRIALAAWERQGRYDAFDVQTRAQRRDGDRVLDGHKTLVLGAASANWLLVLARESGDARSTTGLSLFMVPADSAGLSVRGLPTYDGNQTADLTLTEVLVPEQARVGQAGQAWPVVEAAIDRATAMACMQAVGTMDRCLMLTRDYLLTRKQFGKAITDNQVVRHRLVDMMVATEQSRAISEAAAQALSADATRRRRAVSIAKAFVSEAGRRVGEDAVQLHGAIGMTDDYEIGQCYKRLAATANLFGDAQWHGERLAQGEAAARV